MNDSIINNSVIFVSDDTTIQNTVQTMVDNQVSSVLIIDKEDMVVGIITERDIVRKFTLLDVEDKYERLCSAIMTRPVYFVEMKQFSKQALRLHSEKNIRHFPILKSKEHKKSNVIGIVSITDLLHGILDSGEIATPPSKEVKHFGRLFLLAKKESEMECFHSIFNDLGYEAIIINSFDEFLKKHLAKSPPVIVDMDYYSQSELHDLITKARKYPGAMILTSSNPSLISLLQKFQKNKNRFMALKPVDFSYVHWLLSQKWSEVALKKGQTSHPG